MTWNSMWFAVFNSLALSPSLSVVYKHTRILRISLNRSKMSKIYNINWFLRYAFDLINIKLSTNFSYRLKLLAKPKKEIAATTSVYARKYNSTNCRMHDVRTYIHKKLLRESKNSSFYPAENTISCRRIFFIVIKRHTHNAQEKCIWIFSSISFR